MIASQKLKVGEGGGVPRKPLRKVGGKGGRETILGLMGDALRKDGKVGLTQQGTWTSECSNCRALSKVLERKEEKARSHPRVEKTDCPQDAHEDNAWELNAC